MWKNIEVRQWAASMGFSSSLSVKQRDVCPGQRVLFADFEQGHGTWMLLFSEEFLIKEDVGLKPNSAKGNHTYYWFGHYLPARVINRWNQKEPEWGQIYVPTIISTSLQVDETRHLLFLLVSNQFWREGNRCPIREHQPWKPALPPTLSLPTTSHSYFSWPR